MTSVKLLKVFVVLVFIVLLTNLYMIFLYAPVVTAQQKYQKLSEIKVSPNVQGAVKAVIPQDYGELKGIENVGRSTMLWFESKDGIIRRVNLSFWKDEIILDNLVVVLERR